jgi:hypothetical protein
VERKYLFRHRRFALLAACLAAFILSRSLQADEIWTLDFSGTDGYSDTLSITGTITTAPGTSPLTVDGVNLTFAQVGYADDPGVTINDTSTSLSNFDSADNLLYTSSPYLDSDGLSFLLSSDSNGSDYSGNVNISSDEGVGYCVPFDDEPSFCGTLTITPQAPVSAVPEPSSLLFFGLVLLAISRTRASEFSSFIRTVL